MAGAQAKDAASAIMLANRMVCFLMRMSAVCAGKVSKDLRDLNKKTPAGTGVCGDYDVEMGGVEPPSEEKTTQATTYVFCLSHLAGPHPTDRTLAEQPHVVRPIRRAASKDAHEESILLSCQKSAPLWSSTGETPRDGLLKV